MGLKVFQSLWAMEPWRDLGATIARVSEAGFDGLAVDLGAADAALAWEALPHMERAGLTPLVVAFPRAVSSLRETLRMARTMGAPFVVVIGQVFPLTVEGAIPVVRRWIEMSEEEGVPIQFETHRNCITNDLFFTLQLLDAVPEMRLAIDLSHYVVDRELRLPLSDFDGGLFRRCLERGDSFQGRVASRQQIQLPLDFPQHAKWRAQFEAWWREGFRLWRSRRGPGEDCVFLCELGPPEYAVTDRDGRELSDRWTEALALKATAERLWAAAAPKPEAP
jgi:Sugar phosphate isomerases/epimerases